MATIYWFIEERKVDVTLKRYGLMVFISLFDVLELIFSPILIFSFGVLELIFSMPMFP